MPIYYKKVNSNQSDVNLVDKGNRFAFGIRKKLANINSRANSKGDGLELRKINRETSQLLLDSTINYNENTAQPNETSNECTEKIITKYGPVVVVKHGSIEEKKPIIFTYHDIGLNNFSNFESFFSITENKPLMDSFAVLHMNAPGQQQYADDLPTNYSYPSMDDLAEQILEVIDYLHINSFIGFGFGAGANILSRFALTYSDKVDALFLINPSATTSTWSEWIYQKMNLRQLAKQVDSNCLSQSVNDYLIWHLFGNLNTPDRKYDEEAIDLYRKYFNGNHINARNLSLFIDSYIRRTSLDISRNDALNNFKCNVLVLCGAYSPHLEESIKMNSRLIPTNSSWIKLSDCGMVLEEQPHKVVQVLRLFLQGLGYTLKARETKSTSLHAGMSLPCLTSSQNSLYAMPDRRSTLAAINEV